LDLAKRALLEGHWRRTSDVKGDKAVENMRLLVILGGDPATADCFVARNVDGQRRYPSGYGDLDDELNNYRIEIPNSRSV
jgi:hypothetical protein